MLPRFQLYIVRILAMVPIYSLTAWFALIIRSERGILILDLVRDSYEAVVIYNFVVLLINYGGGHLHLCRYLEGHPRMEHPFPLGLYLPPLKMGPAFLGKVRIAVLQFVFVKPVNSAFKLYLNERSTSSSLFSLPSVVIIIVNNLSVSAALYGLVLFYHAAEPLLRPYRPFEKFIAVKAVIFFSFWQGLALSLMKRVGIIHDVPGFSADYQTTRLQDVLICVEMAIAAITHLFVFSWTEYARLHPQQRNQPQSINRQPSRNLYHNRASIDPKYPLLQVVDFRDVLSDAKDRFYGGVGFEKELVDGAPVVPGYVIPESQTYQQNASSSPPSSWSKSQYRSPHGYSSSVSADLMAVPWRGPPT